MVDYHHPPGDQETCPINYTNDIAPFPNDVAKDSMIKDNNTIWMLDSSCFVFAYSGAPTTMALQIKMRTVSARHSLRLNSLRVGGHVETSKVTDIDAADFTLENDDFLPNGDWNSTFLVTFKLNKLEDRLFCEAPFGEYFLRFGVDVVLEKKIWERESHTILAAISKFDIILMREIT